MRTERTNHSKERNEARPDPEGSTKDQQAGPKQETLYESLILAQDERWRRA